MSVPKNSFSCVKRGRGRPKKEDSLVTEVPPCGEKSSGLSNHQGQLASWKEFYEVIALYDGPPCTLSTPSCHEKGTTWVFKLHGGFEEGWLSHRNFKFLIVACCREGVFGLVKPPCPVRRSYVFGLVGENISAAPLQSNSHLLTFFEEFGGPKFSFGVKANQAFDEWGFAATLNKKKWDRRVVQTVFKEEGSRWENLLP